VLFKETQPGCPETPWADDAKKRFTPQPLNHLAQKETQTQTGSSDKLLASWVAVFYGKCWLGWFEETATMPTLAASVDVSQGLLTTFKATFLERGLDSGSSDKLLVSLGNSEHRKCWLVGLEEDTQTPVWLVGYLQWAWHQETPRHLRHLSLSQVWESRFGSQGVGVGLGL
jgi:hypothetical protein